MFDQIIFNNPLRNWLWFIYYILIGIIFSWIGIYLSKKIFQKINKKSKNKITDIVLRILSNPTSLKILIFIIFFNKGLKFLNIGVKLLNLTKQIIGIAIIIGITLFLSKFLTTLIERKTETNAKLLKSKNKDYIVPLLKSIIKITLYSFAGLIILSRMGYNVTALLAGLGIGGIAIAFAAKDILENLISGITIFLEKPFKIGETLRTSEGYGKVEEIGIRSTKIRTLDNTVVIVPNRLLSTNAVENITARRGRKENYALRLVYGTSVNKIKKAKKIIIDTLESHELVEKKTYVVGFEAFGDYSLNIRVMYWVITTSYAQFLETKDSVNSNIIKQFEKEKIEFAIPTQKILK